MLNNGVRNDEVRAGWNGNNPTIGVVTYAVVGNLFGCSCCPPLPSGHEKVSRVQQVQGQENSECTPMGV
jgi:hypothetical protein